MYGGRRAGLQTDPEKEMKDIQRCMDALRAMEKTSVLDKSSVISINAILQMARSWQILVGICLL